MTDRDKTCFVLMPFAEEYREVYEQVYRPVCNAAGIRCWRVDEVAGPGSITRDIVEGIIDADIIISDLTSQNPNVFYELGIAHAVGNKTIMTCQRIEDVPFDIGNYRVILYDQTIAGSKKLTERLTAAIQELLAALDRTNNPVQSVLGGRAGAHFLRRVPLFRVVDITVLTRPLRLLLEEKSILYVDQLGKLDLEEIVSREGFGADSLSQLALLIRELDVYSDAETFQRFLTENNIRLSRRYGGERWGSLLDSLHAYRQST